MPVPNGRAPSSRDCRFNVARTVVDEKEVERLEACPQLYGFKKTLRWLGDAKGRSVMNGSEMAFEAQRMPKISGTFMLLNCREMQFQTGLAKGD